MVGSTKPREAGRKQPADDGRHFGFVVDDKEAARAALKAAGIKPIDGRFPDFRDFWGNRTRSWATTTSNSPRLQTSCGA